MCKGFFTHIHSLQEVIRVLAWQQYILLPKLVLGKVEVAKQNMTLSQQEYNAIINDYTKTIAEDIVWEGSSNSLTKEFRIDVTSDEGYPIFVKGWYNPYSGKLSYAIIHRSVGRIYGLDLGADHRNPNGELVGEKHKNHWVPGSRDKWAYVPEDITETWDRPVAVWHQFCTEAHLHHPGRIEDPITLGILPL